MSAPAAVWIPAKDAAALVNRKERTVYSWAKKGHVRSRRNAVGVLEFLGADLLRAEATLKRGRPRGSARPSTL
jgi:hypothetical protein